MKLMSTPRSVDIDITNRCNLRCAYCYHFTSAGDVEKDLPKEEWLQFFEELNKCNVMNVVLSGGEPFFRSDIKELIQGIVNNRMRYSILSNGTLITEEIASFIAATGRCNSVQVSIDGSSSSIHDSFRGKGNFDRAIRGIRTLQSHGITVNVRATIHKNNVRDLENITKLLLEDIGLPGFSTNSATYTGLCRNNSELVQLSTQERAIAMESLYKLNKKYAGRISANAGPLAEARFWTKMEKARIDGKTRPGGGHLTGCNCVMGKLAVRADGVIIPCNQLSHIELGRINRDSLVEIWRHHPEMLKLRQRNTIPLSDFEYCRGCAYIPNCTGNCPGLAYMLLGDINLPSPDACLKKYFEDGGILPEILFEG
jgi:SynChlorMet cassette radical SAM/SPASM protein ScmE